jgi:hypothetical protein
MSQLAAMMGALRWLYQLRDADAGQKHPDSVIHPAQRLFHPFTLQ